MKTLALAVLILFLSGLAIAQDVPDAKVCISQAAANKCRDNAAEVERIPVLEEKIKALEKSRDERRKLWEKNKADLIARINKLTSDLAFEKGIRAGVESERNTLLEILRAMAPRLRKKCAGLVLFC